MQLNVQQELAGDCINSRLQFEPNNSMEVPNHAEDSNFNWSFLPSAVPEHESMRSEHSDWRRR